MLYGTWGTDVPDAGHDRYAVDWSYGPLKYKDLEDPKMNAAWESLHRATHELASSDPLKQRLIVAFSKYLSNLDPGALPAEHRGRFESLTTRLTEVRPMRGESAVMATVRKMSNQEASECAHQLIDLLTDVTSVSADASRSRSRKVVTLYSAEA